jgi:prepilin-type processing-associated H-X9-DG protein
MLWSSQIRELLSLPCQSSFESHRLRSCVEQKRFTLIELLVVIVVIMILLSMMMSSLQHAKSVAIRVACMSNIRQLAMAAGGIYTTDNDRVVVPAVLKGPTTRDHTPAIRDQGQYAVHTAMGYSVMWLEEIEDKTIDLSAVPEETNPLGYCPGDETYGGLGDVARFQGTLRYYSNKTGWWCGIYRRQPSYSLNYFFTNAKGNGPMTENRELNYIRINRTENPGEKVLLCETHYTAVAGARWEFANTWPGCNYERGPYPMTKEPYISYAGTGAISYARHDGLGFNVAFADLHAEFIESTTAPHSPWKKPVSAADIAEMERLWMVEYDGYEDRVGH